MDEPFDLLVIGGGINGTGIARDAAGRGLSVCLCEKDDLAQGTSSRSGKLVHGGLRYLEYYEFRLVREALIEREVLLRAAPHIIWPMRFVLPHTKEQRPAWLIRLGLFLYDHLGGRKILPPTRRLNLRQSAEGVPLKDTLKLAFEYSDCWVDDARLVVLNARDAAALGADIRTRTTCQTARRDQGLWQIELAEQQTGNRTTIQARAIVNAAGPWINDVLGQTFGVNSQRRVRLVKGSHIITEKFWEGDQAYLLQNDDGRVIFVNPYEDGLALIGTTDIPVEGDPGEVQPEEAELTYLINVINRYFKVQLGLADIRHSFAGVRPLFDDNAANPSAVTRDYSFDVTPKIPTENEPPLLSIFGGKITTYRKLAEHALDQLSPFFPQAKAPWTAHAPLPGGDIDGFDIAAFEQHCAKRYPWLPAALRQGYVKRYGSDVHTLLDGAVDLDGLGRQFGAHLFEKEARFLMDFEWAIEAEDILERRTKHGLGLNQTERAEFTNWLAAQQSSEPARSLHG